MAIQVDDLPTCLLGVGDENLPGWGAADAVLAATIAGDPLSGERRSDGSRYEHCFL